MKAVILAGGFGTRLHPITKTVPKPLVPVRGKPCMEHTLRLLADSGVTDAVVTLHYLGEKIREYFGDERFGVRLEYMTETEPLGTAGCVRAAAEHLDGDFFVISADVYCTLDLRAAAGFHRSKDADITMLLYEAEDVRRYGVVDVEGDGRVTGFTEKPESAVASHTVNTGIYVLNERILHLIPAGRKYDFSRDLFPLMLDSGYRLYGCRPAGNWRDIGSIGEFYACNTCGGKSSVGEGCGIGHGVKISGSVIFDNVKIAEGAQVVDSIVCEGAEIGRGVRVPRGSIIESGAVVNAAYDFGNARNAELYDASGGDLE